MKFEIVDLAEQDIRDTRGVRITQETVDALVQVAERARAGRPSLTAPGRRSPTVTLRFSESVNARLSDIATRTGRAKSQVVRDAVDRYLAA